MPDPITFQGHLWRVSQDNEGNSKIALAFSKSELLGVLVLGQHIEQRLRVTIGSDGKDPLSFVGQLWRTTEYHEGNSVVVFALSFKELEKVLKIGEWTQRLLTVTVKIDA